MLAGAKKRAAFEFSGVPLRVPSEVRQGVG